MNRTNYWLILVAVLLTGLMSQQTVRAQVSSDAQRRYQSAVQFVKNGDYERAKKELNVFIQQRGPLAPYANYYYTLAAFRQKNFTQARLSARQLMESFPGWRKMDEARYLFGAICMETGQYEDALNTLKKISDPALQADITNLEQTFLPRLTDLPRLKEINRLFPTNRIVGVTLIDLIRRTGSAQADQALADRLTSRFGVPGTAQSQPPVAINQPISTSASAPVNPSKQPARAKGYFNVAVMFPFRVDEFNADKRMHSSQFVYDLYNGIRMAKTRLQQEGITVNIYAYDLDNDANRALEIINNPAFAQTDLVIGPLYAEPNRIVSAYANQNGIVQLNPIATSSELIVNQPLAFLAQPSLHEQARKAADVAQSLNGGRRAAIYYGSSRKDSLLAATYLVELKQRNYQVADFRKLGGSAQAMAAAMQFSGLTAQRAATVGSSSTAQTAATDTPIPVTVSHVFFASSNEKDGSRMVDALSRRKVSGPLIATASAFDFYRDSQSIFTRRELYLLYPDFIDSSREIVADFEEQYVATRKTIPSVFASEGYDMMLFFGRQLAKTGRAFQNNPNLRSTTDDYLLSGFDYSQSNENQIVPIVKYEDGRFVKVNE